MLITTTKGMMEADELERRAGVFEDENERTTWVEYWDDGELVHRSAHVDLKQGLFAQGHQATFS